MADILRCLAALLSFASVCEAGPVTVAQGQEQVDPKSILGREKAPHQLRVQVTPPLPEPEERALVAKLQAIRDLLLATPALRTLRGYDWDTFAVIKPAELASAPLPGFLGFRAFAYLLDRETGRAVSSDDGLAFEIHVNDPDATVGGSSGYQIDQQARITFEPKVTGRLDGFPIYEDEFVVLSTGGRSVFTPMSEQRFLEYEIDRTRKMSGVVQGGCMEFGCLLTETLFFSEVRL